MKQINCTITLTALLCLSLIGCGSYVPTKVDPKTGLYGTTTELDSSAILKYNSTVDLSKFRFITLNASTNIYQGRFEFFVRNILADAEMKRVLNQEEFFSFVKDHPKLKELTSLSDPLSIKKMSDTVGPFLIVEFSSQSDGNVRRYVTLKITDSSTGTELLHIKHNKTIWIDVDPEAHYPVFNVFRKWVQEINTKKNAA